MAPAAMARVVRHHWPTMSLACSRSVCADVRECKWGRQVTLYTRHGDLNAEVLCTGIDGSMLARIERRMVMVRPMFMVLILHVISFTLERQISPKGHLVRSVVRVRLLDGGVASATLVGTFAGSRCVRVKDLTGNLNISDAILVTGWATRTRRHARTKVSLPGQ